MYEISPNDVSQKPTFLVLFFPLFASILQAVDKAFMYRTVYKILLPRI
jgi:hypothetical protein